MHIVSADTLFHRTISANTVILLKVAFHSHFLIRILFDSVDEWTLSVVEVSTSDSRFKVFVSTEIDFNYPR